MAVLRARAQPTSGTRGADSAIRLVETGSGREYATAREDEVRLSSARRCWTSPMVFEVHQMAPHAYDEHVVVGHQLMVNLGPAVRLAWREGDRRREGHLDTGALCIQSEGDSNAPSWRDEMCFATASFPQSMIEALLGERAPQADATFAKQHCVSDLCAHDYVLALVSELTSPSEPLYAEALSQAFILHLLRTHGRGSSSASDSPRSISAKSPKGADCSSSAARSLPSTLSKMAFDKLRVVPRLLFLALLVSSCGHAASPSYKKVVTTWYEAFNTKDPALVDAILSANWDDIPPAPGQLPGRQGAKDILAQLTTGFPDLKLTIKDVMQDDDKVIVRSEITGTQTGLFMGFPPKNRKIAIQAIDIHQLEDGKIVRSWHTEDWMTAMRQMGVFEK